MGQIQNYVDEDLFRFILDLELQKALRLQYYVSVVCFTPDPVPGNADASLLRHMAQRTLRLLRATDVATTFSDTTNCIGLLLVDAEARSLPGIVSRVRELPAGPEGDREERLSWSAGGSCYPQTVTSARDLLAQATDLMARAKAEGGNRVCLPS